MQNKSFTVMIEVAKSPQDVFNIITDVSKWWGGKDLEGNSKKSMMNLSFTIRELIIQNRN
jgi:hypothetical protein